MDDHANIYVVGLFIVVVALLIGGYIYSRGNFIVIDNNSDTTQYWIEYNTSYNDCGGVIRFRDNKHARIGLTGRIDVYEFKNKTDDDLIKQYNLQDATRMD